MAVGSVYVPIEPLLGKIGSLYKLVILAARRALELNGGSPPLLEGEGKRKPSTVALDEIAGGKVSLKAKGEKRKREEF